MFADAFPIISTPDLSAALRFYRDLLDGEVEYRFPPEGNRHTSAWPSARAISVWPWGERIASAPDRRWGEGGITSSRWGYRASEATRSTNERCTREPLDLPR